MVLTFLNLPTKTKILRNKQTLTLQFVLRLQLSSRRAYNALQACRTGTARIRHTNSAYQKRACVQWLIELKRIIKCPKSGKQIHMVLYLSNTARIESKFCMHMQCDQPIISHFNTKLIWGHLDYANEGQSSNPSLYCISATTAPIEPRFCMHM